MHGFLVVVALTVAPAQASVLTGTVDIERLGRVTLPSGEWRVLESHISQLEAKTPDVFVFDKVTASPSEQERLTVMRYDSHIAPEHPAHLCDVVGSSAAFGIPHFLERHEARRSKKLDVHMLRQPTDWKSNQIEVTYVYSGPDRIYWMSHAILVKKDQSAIVCIHCAPRVLSPAPLQDFWFESSLSTAK